MKILYYLRSGMYVLILFPLITIVYSLIGIFYYYLTGRRTIIDWVAWSWANLTLWFLNVEVVESGKENIVNLSGKSGSLLLFNHTSFMDIFSILSGLPHTYFGAKIELYSIPIFNMAMHAGGILPISRKNLKKSIEVLNDAEDRARHGERFALAPEGGRNQEEKLLPFKSGPFIFAIKTGVPIVPVIIKGASLAWPKNALIPCTENWKHKITIQYLPPVSTKEYTFETRAELVFKVREMMLAYF